MDIVHVARFVVFNIYAGALLRAQEHVLDVVDCREIGGCEIVVAAAEVDFEVRVFGHRIPKTFCDVQVFVLDVFVGPRVYFAEDVVAFLLRELQFFR